MYFCEERVDFFLENVKDINITACLHVVKKPYTPRGYIETIKKAANKAANFLCSYQIWNVLICFDYLQELSIFF